MPLLLELFFFCSPSFHLCHAFYVYMSFCHSSLIFQFLGQLSNLRYRIIKMGNLKDKVTYGGLWFLWWAFLEGWMGILLGRRMEEHSLGQDVLFFQNMVEHLLTLC